MHLNYIVFWHQRIFLLEHTSIMHISARHRCASYPVIELANALEESRRMDKLHEISERVLTKERDDAWRESMRLNAEVVELDTDKKNLARQLFICMNELDKLSEKSTNTPNSNG